jgi:hypothetical protein
MTNALTIRLSDSDRAYLLSAGVLPPRLSALVLGSRTELNVTPEQSEEFRAALTERLAHSGFDGRYALTPEGQILEALIDKFFRP